MGAGTGLRLERSRETLVRRCHLWSNLKDDKESGCEVFLVQSQYKGPRQEKRVWFIGVLRQLKVKERAVREAVGQVGKGQVMRRSCRPHVDCT